MTKSHGINDLHGIAQFSLFVTSYLPLFFLIIIRQLVLNFSFLNFGGFTFNASIIFFQKFGISALLIAISIIGFWGFIQTISNIEANAENGFPVKIIDISNKNGEAIGYIATYIIPFLFQNLNNWIDFLSITFLLLVIYRIYINSTLLLINPILSFKYSIFEIEYLEGDRSKRGLIISKDKYLPDDSEIKIYEIGYKLYYAINNSKL